MQSFRVLLNTIHGVSKEWLKRLFMMDVDVIGVFARIAIRRHVFVDVFIENRLKFAVFGILELTDEGGK